jgi:hypothetical protein
MWITVDLMEVTESKESDFVDGVWQATSITRLPMLLLDTRLPFGSLIPGCEELLDPAGTGSFYNEGEADIVVEHITALLAAGVSANSIAVQSPYMAQVQLLCDRIEAIPGTEGIEVASIDSFQGREADAVVISMVYLLSCHSAP